MTMRRRRLCLSLTSLAAAAALPGCGGGGGGEAPAPAPSPAPTPAPTPPPAASGPAWWGFGRDAQHSANSAIASQDLTRIRWSTPVDLAPQYQANGNLLIHYGSPVISGHNTVVLPVKTAASSGFRVEGRAGADGALVWSLDTDYRLPPHNWVPSYNPAIAMDGRVVMAGSGGTLLVRDSADGATANVRRIAFYGDAVHAADPAGFDAAVCINTPVTLDAQGNAYFGFMVLGANAAQLASGLARVGADGSGRWIGAAAAAADPAIAKVAMNCAPALSPDGSTVYVAVNLPFTAAAGQYGYLLALDSATFAIRGKASLVDPASGLKARITDNGTASPSVGPDGRVYYGVQENPPASHNGRGWMMQFDAALATQGVPGSFGWDITATIVPAAMVPAYTGDAAYLIGVKYNNYAYAGGGDGQNRIAVLDPTATQSDPYRPQVTVMREVLTKLGPTFESGTSGPIKEWCINTMAADPARKSILVNSEDGILYRWDLPTNELVQPIRLNNGLGQAYTPTAIGPDGAVYAISNARLYCVGV
jgi:hypothetical protein